MRNLRDFAGQWQAAPPWRRAAFLTCYCAALFILVNWRNYVVDDIPQSLVPVVLWREGTIRLDAYRPAYEALQQAGQHYAFTESGGHLYPRNSVYVSLLVAPLYLPPVLAGVPTDNIRFWVAWGGFAAAFWTGVAVGLCYLTLRRWGDDTAAAWLSLLFAFGTCLWTTIAHTVYDHLGGLVCVAALVWVLDAFPLRPGRAALAAFLAGAAVGMRPSTVVLLFPLGVFLFCWPGRLAGWRARLAALAAISVVPLSNAWLNAWCFGHWSKTGYPADLANDWGNPWWEGLPGLLVSPNSGLLVQSPFLVLALVGGWAAWRSADTPERGLLRAYTACFVSYWILFAHRNQWQGGLDFSSRYLSEGYPLWMPLAMVGWNQLRTRPHARPLLVAAGVWSVLYQLANLATFDRITDQNPAHLPWQPAEHFLCQYVRQEGVVALVRATGLALGLFLLGGLGVAFVLRPFFLPPPPKADAEAGDAAPVMAAR